MLPSYGMTECMPITAPPQDFELSQRIGTSGRSVGPELSILDGNGAELPYNSIGNICIRGPPVFNGYEDPVVCVCVRAGEFLINVLQTESGISGVSYLLPDTANITHHKISLCTGKHKF